MNKTVRKEFLYAFACSAAAFIVYLMTLMPGIGGWGDSARFGFFGRTLGASYPTGYPLYIIINNVFSRIPVGSLAFRANLMSAFFAAATLFALFLIIKKIGGVNFTAAVSSLLFGFSRVFWSQSVIAEVYTLNCFLVAMVILMLTVWRQSGRINYLWLALFLFSLGLGNHLTTVLLIPAVLFIALDTDHKALINGKTPGIFAGMLAFGILLYAYVFIRSMNTGAYLEMRVSSLGDFIRMFTGGHFKSQMFSFTARQLISQRLPAFIVLLSGQFTITGYILGLAGMCLLLRDRLKYAIFLALTALAYIFYALNYNIPDIDSYYIPAFLVFAIFAGAGMNGLNAVSFIRKNRMIRRVVKGTFILLPVLVMLSNYTAIDQSKNVSMDGFTNAILDEVEENSVIITSEYNYTQYYLYKLIGERKRRDDGMSLLWCWDPVDRLTPYLSASLSGDDTVLLESIPLKGVTGGYPRLLPPGTLRNMNIYFHKEDRKAFNKAGIPSRKVLSLTCRGLNQELYKVISKPSDNVIGSRYVEIYPVNRNRRALKDIISGVTGSIRINFGYSDRRYLSHGWSRVEYNEQGTPFCWANGKSSSIIVPFSKTGRYGMCFRARPYSRGSRQQTLEMFINGKKCADVVLSDGWKNYPLVISEGYIKRDNNIIKFIYKYTDSPLEVSGMPDRRELAAAFEWIKFSKK